MDKEIYMLYYAATKDALELDSQFDIIAIIKFQK